MKDFIHTQMASERAILVGLITANQNEAKTNEYLDELAFLAETAGAQPERRFLQRLDYPNTRTYVGTGKLQEIKEYIEMRAEEEDGGVGLVIFDDELSPKQLQNIERELQVKILDRTTLILHIFALRAQTANAKTQVELACGLTWSVNVVVSVCVVPVKHRLRPTVVLSSTVFRASRRSCAASIARRLYNAKIVARWCV